MTDCLELKGAEMLVAKLEWSFAFIVLPDKGACPVRMQGKQPQQVVGSRANRPTGSINFGPPVAKGLRVAGRNKWCERSPSSGSREKRAVIEIDRLPDAMKHQTNIMTTVAPDLVQPAQGKTSRFVKALRRPDRDMRYRVTRTVRFAKNMSMAVVLQRFPILTQAREH
jgi:hypothetical protein